MAVASVDAAEKDPKAISRWISSINDLHRHTPPTRPPTHPPAAQPSAQPSAQSSTHSSADGSIPTHPRIHPPTHPPTDTPPLSRHKPPPSVHYSKPMPDIEALMQIWPAQFEELLETAKLPGADLQVCAPAPLHHMAPQRACTLERLHAAPLRPSTPCTPLPPLQHPCTRVPPPLQAELPELVRIVCALLDIPVYSSLTESLHVLFSLYSDFKANVHFQQQITEEGGMGGMGGSDGMGMLNDAMGHSDQLIMPS